MSPPRFRLQGQRGLALHRISKVIFMANFYCDPLALTTAINTLAVAIAAQLSDDELNLVSAVFNQLGETLGTIATQREICAPR